MTRFLSDVEPIILIAGKAGTGKTSVVADYFGRKLEKVVANTSDVIFEELAKDLGTTVEELTSRDKETIRPKLIEVGDRICEKSPDELLMILIGRGAGVIAGLRKKKELDAFSRRGIPFVTVWVRRDSAEEVVDNLDLCDSDCSYVVDNSSSREDSERALEEVLGSITRSLRPS